MTESCQGDKLEFQMTIPAWPAPCQLGESGIGFAKGAHIHVSLSELLDLVA
jgi:hypothetical protein